MVVFVSWFGLGTSFQLGMHMVGVGEGVRVIVGVGVGNLGSQVGFMALIASLAISARDGTKLSIGRK
jgi:hypothetical protein